MFSTSMTRKKWIKRQNNGMYERLYYKGKKETSWWSKFFYCGKKQPFFYRILQVKTQNTIFRSCAWRKNFHLISGYVFVYALLLNFAHVGRNYTLQFNVVTCKENNRKPFLDKGSKKNKALLLDEYTGNENLLRVLQLLLLWVWSV